MKVWLQASMIALVVMMIGGCGGEDVDIEPPTLEVIRFDPMPVEDDVCGSPAPHVFHLRGGDTLEFDVLCKDDLALSQYKLDIHNNFDCHGHGGGQTPSVSVPGTPNETQDWSLLEIQSLSGMESIVEGMLEVPENVTAGNYHFQIQVIDEAGNDSPMAHFYSLTIMNPLDDIPPQLTVDRPATSELSIGRGESIRFSGVVMDDRSLSDGGNGVLFLSYTDLESGNTFATDAIFVFADGVSTHYDFDFEYQVPQSIKIGHYRYSLGATDGVRNVASFVYFDVEVKD